MHADGRNPFEEFGVIPADWSPTEKLSAIQFMKETDCLYALVCGNEGFEQLPLEFRTLASMLLKDPVERTREMDKMIQLNSEALIAPVHIQEGDSAADVSIVQKQVSEVTALLQTSTLQPEEMFTAIDTEEQSSLPDPLSVLSNFMGKAFVPNCVSSRFPSHLRS